MGFKLEKKMEKIILEEKNKNLLAFLTIAILVLIVYSNALNATFIYEDRPLILGGFIKSLSFKDTFLVAIQQTFFPENIKKGILYRPVLMLTFFFDYHLWKDRAFGYHITNIFLHIINCVVLFFLLNQIFKSRNLSFITVVLFAIHPIQVESVTWISGRNGILLSIFILLAFLLYMKKKLLLSYIAFLLSLFTKESSIFLLLLFIIYDIFFRRKAVFFENVSSGGEIHDKHIASNYIGFFLTIGIYFCVRYFVLKYLDVNSGIINVMIGSVYFKNFIKIPLYYLNYVKLLLFPTGYAFIPIFLFNNTACNIRFLYGAISVLGFILIFLIFRKSQILKFSLSWFLIALIPYSGIIPTPWPLMEHRLYLPSIGFFICISYGICHFIDNPRKYLKISGSVLLVILIICFSVVTYNRNKLYQSALMVWESTVRNNPSSITARKCLIDEYMKREMDRLAIYHLKELIKLENNIWQAHYYLANIYAKKEDFASAIAELEICLNLKTPSPENICAKIEKLKEKANIK